LDAETGLLRITLAAEERVSPATVTQHLKLLELDQDLQAHLLNLTKASEVRRFSLNHSATRGRTASSSPYTAASGTSA
jgi:hypothetical protein